MKLRIRADSLRLRLTRPEVEQLRGGDAVQATLRIAPGRALTYGVEPTGEIQAPTVTFDGAALRLRIPSEQARAWASGAQTSLRARQDAGNGELRIVLEKDFECLAPADRREPGDDDGTFPHPRAGRDRC